MPLDCICDGNVPWCAPCLLEAAVALRFAHPDSLSVGMLKRRIPGITGREASLLLEASRRIIPRRRSTRLTEDVSAVLEEEEQPV